MKGGVGRMDDRIIGIGLVVGILVVIGFIASSGGATVSAEGFSSLDVKPDKVSVHLRIEERNESAEIAKDQMMRISDSVFIELIRLGFDRDDIQLESYNINPEYDWSGGGRKQIGFVASQQILVKTSEFDLVASIVDRVIDSGALVSYINFELSSERQNEYKVKALEMASDDARMKASATASGLGKNLGKLVSVKGDEFNYGPVVYYEARDFGIAETEVAKDAALNLAPRDLKVSARVRVQYQLGRF